MKEFSQLQKWKIESLIEKYTKNDNGDFDIKLSKETAYLDDEKKSYSGLLKTQMFNIDNRDIYVFDNHNKAIFSVLEQNDKYGRVFDILHIDAHRDDAIFQNDYPKEINKKNIQEVFEQSRISDYLDLMTKTKMIAEISNVTQSREFENFIFPKKEFILNLDIDIFGDDGEVVDLELKIMRIVQSWKIAKSVMIATSPGFINQKNAKFLIEVFLKRI